MTCTVGQHLGVRGQAAHPAVVRPVHGSAPGRPLPHSSARVKDVWVHVRAPRASSVSLFEKPAHHTSSAIGTLKSLIVKRLNQRSPTGEA